MCGVMKYLTNCEIKYKIDVPIKQNIELQIFYDSRLLYNILRTKYIRFYRFFHYLVIRTLMYNSD